LSHFVRESGRIGYVNQRAWKSISKLW
jgi:hypothetical protein